MTEKSIFDGNYIEPIFVKTDYFELACFSKRCPGKETPNEDSVGYLEFGKKNILLTVADGAGGYPKGESASSSVINQLKSKIESGANGKEKVRNSILDALEEVNSNLLKEGLGSRTTATVCHIEDGKLRSFHVGDSGAIVCGLKGKLKFQTLSHSPVGYGVEAGLISEYEALDHPDLHFVANLVGDPMMTIEMGPPIDLDDKDTVLVASDGLLDNLSTTQLVELIRKGSIEEVSIEIIKFFKDREVIDPNGENTKFDDLSFILCRLL